MLPFTGARGENADEAKFTRLYNRYKRMMLKIADDRVHNAAVAEECVHDAFAYIAKNLAKIGDVESSATRNYVLTVTVTCAVKAFYREKKHETVPLTEDPDGEEFLTELTGDDVNDVADALAAMEEKYAYPFVLRYRYDYSYKQLAKLLGVNEAAARKRVERAREKLREALGEYNG